MAKSAGLHFGFTHEENEEEFNKFEEPTHFVSEPVRPEFASITKLLAHRIRERTEDIKLEMSEEVRMEKFKNTITHKNTTVSRRPRF